MIEVAEVRKGLTPSIKVRIKVGNSRVTKVLPAVMGTAPIPPSVELWRVIDNNDGTATISPAVTVKKGTKVLFKSDRFWKASI